MDRKQFFPAYINKRFQELSTNPQLNYKHDTITDFLILIQKIWCISNADYQQKIWINNDAGDAIWDSYDDSTMYFGEDADSVIEAYDEGRLHMTEKQYEMLKTLNEMVEAYDLSTERPNDDASIVNDPKWDTIRQYAKLVYKEITGQEA